MMKLKSETYKGYKIKFYKYPNGFVEGTTDGILVGAFKSKFETFNYIKNSIDKVKSNNNYMTLSQFKKEIGV